MSRLGRPAARAAAVLVVLMGMSTWQTVQGLSVTRREPLRGRGVPRSFAFGPALRRPQTVVTRDHHPEASPSPRPEKWNLFGKGLRSRKTRLHAQRQQYIAINGGDLWAGFDCTAAELEELANSVCSTSVERPVMRQFHAGRGWLWRQLKGTMFHSSWKAVLCNSLVALLVTAVFNGHFFAPDVRAGWLEQMTGLERLWRTSSGLVTFVLSFFLNQAYGVWRKCYSISRRIQGRLNDIGLLAASHAERVFHVLPDADGAPTAAAQAAAAASAVTVGNGVGAGAPGTGAVPPMPGQEKEKQKLNQRVRRAQFQAGTSPVDDMMCRTDDLSAYTPAAAELLSELGRYKRLFNVLFYASVSRRHAPLATPEGLKVLQSMGLLNEAEREHILRTATGHNAVVGWITALISAGIADGRLRGGSSLQVVMLQQITQLRATYATINDELSGRMPLAYTHLVQVLVDLFIIMTPLALTSELAFLGSKFGPLRWSFTIVGTAVLTLFYTGILDLAKMFLDPYNNENFGGKYGVKIEVDTLIQETNLGSRRWYRGDSWVPRVAMPRGGVPPVCVPALPGSSPPAVSPTPPPPRPMDPAGSGGDGIPVEKREPYVPPAGVELVPMVMATVVTADEVPKLGYQV